MTKLLKQHSFCRFLLAAICVLTGFAGMAQVTVKGKVTGENGKALSDINVTSTSGSGASTDAKGNYSIIVPSTGTFSITASAVGYKPSSNTITLSGNEQSLDFKLSKDALGLDEVVVTGQVQGTTKRQLGNASSTINSTQLQRSGTGNVLAALQGKVAGAQITQNSGDVGGSMSVRLRGVSTLYGSAEPLYIIDGVVVSNATVNVSNAPDAYGGNNDRSGSGALGQNRLVDINPNDIEKIEVVNGAAAAAQYGSRASNGVVQIFTKRGKAGKPQVSFTSSLIVSQLRKKQYTNLSSGRFEDASRYANGLAYYNSGDYNSLADPSISSANRFSRLTPILAVPSGDFIRNVANFTRYDYQDVIFRTAIGTDNNINVTGGNDQTQYLLSTNYYSNQGIIKNTDFTKFGIRARVDQRISKWLKASVGINYLNNKTNEKPDGNSFFSPINSINITENIYDVSKLDALGKYQAVEPVRVNPNTVINDIKQSQNTNRTIADVQLHATPVKNLTIDYVFGIDNLTNSGQEYIPIFTYPGVSGGFYNDGYAYAATNVSTQINNNISLTYLINVNSKIKATTQVGFDHQYSSGRFTSAEGRALAPFVQTVSGATNILSPASDSRSVNQLRGYFVQENLNFDNKFYVTVGGRLDGSTSYDKSKWNNTYLKTSSSLIVSGFDFWEKAGLSKFWNTFKIRGGYGQSGNLTATGAYDRFTSYNFAPYQGYSGGYASSQLGDVNLNVERQSEVEIGTDMSFLHDRLGIEFTYYSKEVKDLIFATQLAPTTGFSSAIKNLAKMSNKGIELLIKGTPVKSKDFEWNSSFSYNQNKNTVLSIDGDNQGPVYSEGVQNQSGAPASIVVGQPVGVFYGTYYKRNADGSIYTTPTSYKFSNTAIIDAGVNIPEGQSIDPVTGKLVGSALRRVIGNPNPKYTFTAVNDFSFKKLTLHTQIDAVQGVDVFNADKRTRQGVGIGKWAEDEIAGRLPRGWIRSMYSIEEFRIDDGSFVKLRELSLSYDFGKVGKAISSLSFSIIGRNLVSWDKFNGYDPEVNSTGNATVAKGVNFGAVPIPKTFSFVLNARL